MPLMAGERVKCALIGLTLLAGCSSSSVRTAAKPTPSRTPVSPSPEAPAAYPPKSEAGLKALAAEGDSLAVQGFKSEIVGLAPCPQPKRSAALDPALPSRKIAADMLAAWYDLGMAQKCGALLLAYRDASEYGKEFDVGRVILDGSDSTGGKNKLTVDVVVGDAPISFEVDY